mmetsp:Transcript_12600/g.25690  ORF Transcript_12600/g.25690 Transcript_12600/m.25690 type:complete len:814 (+) Transcript_12600:250-2691(+)
MGQTCRKSIVATLPEELMTTKRQFREEKSEFEMTGKVDYNEDEFKFDLRSMLDDPIGQKMLSTQASKLMNRENLFCWIDVHEYHSIPTLDFRRCMAFQIYAKYLKPGAPMLVGGLQKETVDAIASKIKLARTERKPLEKGLFDELGEVCFNELLRSTYLPFRKSPEYRQYKVSYRRTYNLVRTDDFEYMSKLGQGGFGRVVHARKKSTGQHLAMKIQLKTALLTHFRSDIAALESEKLVFASCHHPFIVNMEYSFQTPGHVIIVLDLVTGGDLHQARKACASRRLPEDRMMFYAAEIVLAIDHLHEMGIIYRDLKPQNVLLRADGHVQLTDMGLAAPLDMAWEWDDNAENDPIAAAAMASSMHEQSAPQGYKSDDDATDRGTKSPGSRSPGRSPGSRSPGGKSPTGSRTPNTVDEHKTTNIDDAIGKVNDLEEKYRHQTKILEEAAAAAISKDTDRGKRSSIIAIAKGQDQVEAPLLPPDAASVGSKIASTPHSEMRKKTKVKRSDTGDESDVPFSSASPAPPSSRRKSNTGRGPYRKNSSTRNVGSMRHDLTRGESLLHENLKATEEAPYIPERRKSVVGTRGYMAPEMVELRLKSYDNVTGYSEGVDWFALGVTMFELLTGRRPFDRKRGQPPPAPIHELDSLYNQLALIEGISDEDARRLRKDIEEYETIMAPILYPRYISDESLAMMEGLMCRKLSDRLGCRKDGVMDIKDHIFFKGIDWDSLLNLEITPPFIPEGMDIPERPDYADFDDMMASFDKDKKPSRYNWFEEPTNSGKERFANWDWISPLTLKREMGIEEEMGLLATVEQKK